MDRRRSIGLAGLLVLGLLPPSPASAHSEPLDFVRKERQDRGFVDKSVWGAMARNRRELRRLWKRYEQKGPLPVIRFEKNVAVLAGTHGPGTCRPKLHDLRLNRERKKVVARMYEEEHDGACTADVVPRTFTVAVARADLKPLKPRELKVRARRIDDPNG
ncbi:MAG TPA: hypothetical protein VHJ76_03985 [Actinomycetota bacterium]|nr:hypothetical protein [Actinomycetota bacterium]